MFDADDLPTKSTKHRIPLRVFFTRLKVTRTIQLDVDLAFEMREVEPVTSTGKRPAPCPARRSA
jgi:hypothetical protein